LQESRRNHTSAASGVAYAETCGATTLLNWTEAGPKVVLASLGLSRRARLVAISTTRLGIILTFLGAPHAAPKMSRIERHACLIVLRGCRTPACKAPDPCPPTPSITSTTNVSNKSGNLLYPNRLKTTRSCTVRVLSPHWKRNPASAANAAKKTRISYSIQYASGSGRI
jgi:hypothetical protein